MHLPSFRVARRELRLGSGLILFTYVAAHLVNHALGLISLQAAERGLGVAIAVWHSLPGTLLLYGAAATHIALAFARLYEHRTLRMPPLEIVRIVLGFAIPTLLIAHVVGTRLSFEAYGVQPDYAREVWMLWNSNREARQMALLVPGWLHGCLGINFAFGRRAWYGRWKLVLVTIAVLLPVVAVLGFLEMTKEVSILARDPAWFDMNISVPAEGHERQLAQAAAIIAALYFASIGAVLVARMLRRVIEGTRGELVAITYPGRTVRVPRGWTILEASRSHHIPHVSSCGGRARCSTCRVRVVAGAEHCPPAAPDERATLERNHAPAGTRLACQLRPSGDISIVPLVRTDRLPSFTRATPAVERKVAVMLVALRPSSTLQRLLPQDQLYLLQHLSDIVADAAQLHGGTSIQPSGDAVVALFGLAVDLRTASRQALRAASHVERAMRALCHRVEHELHWVIGFAIDLHAGPAAIGHVGAGEALQHVATGEAIDTGRMLSMQDRFAHAAPLRASSAFIEAAGIDPVAARVEDMLLSDGSRIAITSLDAGAASQALEGAVAA
jgi:adenylate cyclase